MGGDFAVRSDKPEGKKGKGKGSKKGRGKSKGGKKGEGKLSKGGKKGEGKLSKGGKKGEGKGANAAEWRQKKKKQINDGTDSENEDNSDSSDDDDNQGPGNKGGKSKGSKGKKGSGKKGHGKRDIAVEDAEIKELNDRILIEAPKPGQIFADMIGGDGTPGNNGVLTTKLFSDLPISKKTIKGCRDGGFNHMTAIQRCSIPHALAGRDVMGEARTGSGKTLSFLVPVLERLYREKWQAGVDGLGALIISPVKELAHQIFEVLKSVGGEHELSACCVIGGKDLQREKKAMQGMNILIGTPGRLLQHMDESTTLDYQNLQMLVLDEADRILDLGFKDQMLNILDSLPPGRQSLLFSATLKPNIHQLAAVALKKPTVLSIAAVSGTPSGSSTAATPHKLSQNYAQVLIENKVRSLFSFLRAHSQQKTIVFVQSQKQVRYLFELFVRLKPGPKIFQFHGKMSMTKRMVIYNLFTERENASCLIATDVAARGVDFPEVDWVVQMDCPDSVDTYIHRVGRTARYQASGSSLIFLLPTERQGFLDMLARKKGVVEKGKEVKAVKDTDKKEKKKSADDDEKKKTA